MTIVRIRYAKRGQHYHCRLYTTPGSILTFSLCGTLVFNEQEFADIRGEYPEWDWLGEEKEAA